MDDRMFQPQKQLDKPLSRPEATLVAGWLEDIGKQPEQGWLSVWKQTPDKIAQVFSVEKHDVLIAAHRIQEEAK
jgi:hypothetical protein